MVSMIRLKRCKIVGRFIFIGLSLLLIVSVLFGVNVIELGAKDSRGIQDKATLEKILQRLEDLESKVSQIYTENDKLALPAAREYQKKGDSDRTEKLVDLLNPTIVQIIKAVVAIKARKCKTPNDWRHPFCGGKVKWIKALWQKNTECYIEEHHINPTDDCTILKFLSEAEAWCPPLPGRERPDPLLSRGRATIRTDIEGLLKWFKADQWLWMKDRATRLWPYWVEGAKALQKRKPEIEKRAAQKILIFMGTFSVEPQFFKYAYHGGPLGELVQWTDLICSLYILGHDLNISANRDDLKSLLNIPKIKGCASAPRDNEYDQIFTDYNGNTLIMMAVGPNHSQYRCKVRILDSFGTDAEFNFAEYSEPIPGGRSPWANADVNLRQIFTMFPHSPDNSFMGFVVDASVNKTKLKEKEKKKKPIGLVYGKEARFWEGKKDYIDTLSKYLEIHATTTSLQGAIKDVPNYVINHGILKGGDLQKLLDKAKVFIGLGFPYEGPAPLEAIAHGAIFLNAKLDPPHNRLNNGFFKLKPTFRALTSQHPYAESFIGEPHVFTVDIKNISVVENTIKKILKTKVKPYLPLEWTPEGMLERISSFVEYMTFCNSNYKTWPPEDQLQLILGDEGISCKDACWKKGLLCESLFFNKINTQDSFEELRLECDTRDDRGSLVMPAYNTAEKSCVLQNHPLIFSCVASKPKHARLCPCRDFQPQQVALCKKCT